MTLGRQQHDQLHARRGPSLGGPLRLRDEGSFFVNGRVVVTEWPNVPNTGMDAPGHTTIEQMYVQYRIPETPNAMPPLIMVHGSNHTGATWETTPDGREGWATWFTRQGFSVYVVDHAGRGRSGFVASRINAAQASQANDIAVPLATHERAWINFRIGSRYGEVFAGAQFPLDHFAAYSAQLVPNTEVTLEMGGEATVAALAALLDEVGPAIVMVHSQSGAYAMELVRRRAERISALVNIEGDMAPVTAQEIASRFARVPVLSLWGDNSFGAAGRNGDARRNGCRDTVAAIAAAGGRARLMLLPEMGIAGNSHMLMMDRNNIEVAEQVLGWLRETLDVSAAHSASS